MTWTDPILAFLRAHASKGVRDAPEAWLRDWVLWYDRQHCLGVAQTDGEILGVGAAVQVRRTKLGREKTWVKDDPQGDALLVIEVCAACPQALRRLMVMFSHRFPGAWNRLPVLGSREGAMRQYNLKDLVRLYVGTFLPPMTGPQRSEVIHGNEYLSPSAA